jgi:hypothetical protein
MPAGKTGGVPFPRRPTIRYFLDFEKVLPCFIAPIFLSLQKKKGRNEYFLTCRIRERDTVSSPEGIYTECPGSEII